MSNPKFQHRHYKAIADALADIKAAPSFMNIDQDTVTRIEERLVVMFQSDNPGFSASRFRAAANRADNMHGRDKVR